MHDKPLYKLYFWWCFLITKTHFLWVLRNAHAAYGPPALSQLSRRSSSLLFILCLWIGFPQTSSLYSLLDSLHHCCILHFHFPQHESQNYTFPNARLPLNISSNLFYRYLKSRMSDIRLTTFCFQLILLHIFSTSVNGTHCSSISCKMIFLLDPKQCYQDKFSLPPKCFLNLSYFLQFHIMFRYSISLPIA